MTLCRLLMIIISLICTSIGISSLAQSAEQFMRSQPKYSFIENKGQVTDQYHNPNAAVKFILPLPNNNVVLRATGFSYDTYVTEERERKQTIHGGLLKKHEELEKDITFKYHRVDVTFQGANPKPEIIAEGKSTDYSNYYVGALGKEVKVYHYGKIIYKDVYPGIDVEFLARPGSDKPVEYNFIVHPGADMDQIRLRYKGATESKLVDDKLELTLAHGKLKESIPESYWQKSRAREDIRYKQINEKKGEITIGFSNAVAGRQTQSDEALIIDPTPFLEWGTYYGGGGEEGMSMALDGSGNILVTGVTFSANNVATNNAHQTSLRGTTDAFIVKFNSAKLRQWCTYYGGTGAESGSSIAVDGSGNVYVGGETSSSSDIASTLAHQVDYHGGQMDAFLVKFDPDGVRLWGTYYGGSGMDAARSITIDNLSNVLLVGWTTSDDLATTINAHQTSYAGNVDAFVAKFNSSGGQQWGTYYGDIGEDYANGIAADGSGNTYFGGSTTSLNSIAINATHQPNMVGAGDAFIVKVNSQGVPQWGTYYGGNAIDEILSITSNSSGDIFITGETSSTALLASSEGYKTTGDGSDSFVAKFSSSGSQYWSTFYGGTYWDIGNGISIDPEGNSYVVGDEKIHTGDFVHTFIVKFSPSGTFQWNIFHGGSAYYAWTWGNSLAVDPNSNVYVTGSTGNGSLIATPDGYQPTLVGGANAYIGKYNSCESGDASATELNCNICVTDARCQEEGTTQFASSISNGIASWSISDDNAAVSNSISETGLVTWDPSFSGQATITLTVAGCGDPVTRTKTITVDPLASASELSCDICTGTPPTRCQASGTTQFTSSILGNSDWSISDNNPEVSNAISSTGIVTWDPTFSGEATITLTVTGCGSPVIRTRTITVTPLPSATELTCGICGGTPPSRCEGSGATQFSSTVTNGTPAWTISDDHSEVSNTIDSEGIVTWDPAFTGEATITLTVTGCGSPVVRTETITVIPTVSATPLTCDICDLPSPSRCEGAGTTQFVSEISDANTIEWTIEDDNPSVSNAISPEGLVTWNSSFTGLATITLTVTGCGEPVTETKNIFVRNTYNTPTLTLSGPSFVCPGTEAEFNVTVHNASSSPQIEFLINDELLASSQSTSFLVGNWNYQNASFVRCRIPNPNECLAAQGPQSTLLMVYTQLDGVVSIVPQDDNVRCKGPGTTQFTVSENLTDYVWSIADVDPGTSIDQTGLVIWDANEIGYPEVAVAAENCPSVATSMFYYIEAPPPAPADHTDTGCNWEEITLRASGGQNSINWYFDDELVHTGNEYDAGTFPVVDTYDFFTEAVSPVGCKSETRGNVELQITPFCDDDKLNWIETKGLDVEGDIYSHTKQYFDLSGRPLQTQTKLFSPGDGVKILASQGLRDQFGREVGNTLTAPVQFSDFNFYYGFALNGTSAPYSFQDFDGVRLNDPDPVNSTEPGTLGWYYGSNNTMEDHVPVTGYPYSRAEYYPDGTQEVRRAASPGDQHRMGMGHEILTGTFPVFSELDDYLTRRLIALPGIVQDGSLMEEAIQTVTRDENGEYTVSIADRSGNVLMTSRRGPITLLPITNSVTSSGNPESVNYRKMTYFYILHDQVVTISGAADFVAENIVTNESKVPGETFAGAGGKWPAGFYRILLPNPSEITLSYTNRYHEVAYYFYDDAGRLRSSVSPNGLYTWVVAPADKQEAAYLTIDKTTYTYNHPGLLLETIEPDAGRTVYQYRKDGKIRFSQNALQRENEQTGNSKGKFSYTHYDISGRPIESGQYIGTTTMFSSLSSQLEFSDQVEFANADKNDWVKTQYDYADSSIPHLPADLTQEFVRGAVSWTENINIKTWYSYDESGRLAWMAQKPNALDRCFIATYSYDFLGNVIEVMNGSYKSGNLMFPFYHHYDYDQDRRLSKVHTSVDGFTHKVRASYEYYLHGPLKRVELGDQIQGIDFVYNIHGWLTQINHPEGGSNDPGEDGEAGDHGAVKPDVFGMILDYYESSLEGVFQVSSILNTNKPQFFHKIPSTNDKEKPSLLTGAVVPALFFKVELLKNLELIRHGLLLEEKRTKLIKGGIPKVGKTTLDNIPVGSRRAFFTSNSPG